MPRFELIPNTIYNIYDHEKMENTKLSFIARVEGDEVTKVLNALVHELTPPKTVEEDDIPF